MRIAADLDTSRVIWLGLRAAMALAQHAPMVAKAARDASEIDPGGMINSINLLGDMGGQAPGQEGLPM